MDADGEAIVEGERAMVEDGSALIGNRGLKKRFNLMGLQFGTVKEGQRLVEDAGVSCHLNIMSDRERQPDAIVGDARANSLSQVVVAWNKLTTRHG